jgi:hypothetical protein
MRWPVGDAVAAGVASGVLLGLLVLPPTPYQAPWLWLPTVGIVVLWLTVRLLVFDQALRRWRAWQTTPAWEMTTEQVLRKGRWT